MVEYKGVKSDSGGAKTVFRVEDGRIATLQPERSQRVWNHSPDGFNWGYGGSGPAQLALALLLDVTNNKDLSTHLHQSFKAAFVSTWGEQWCVTADQIREWITKNDREVLV